MTPELTKQRAPRPDDLTKRAGDAGQSEIGWGVSREALLAHVSNVIANMEKLLITLFALQLGVFYFALQQETLPWTGAIGLIGVLLFLVIAYFFVYSNLVAHYMWLDIHLRSFKAPVVKEVGILYLVFHVITFLTPSILFIVPLWHLTQTRQLEQLWLSISLLPIVLAVWLGGPFSRFVKCMWRQLQDTETKPMSQTHPTNGPT